MVIKTLPDPSTKLNYTAQLPLRRERRSQSASYSTQKQSETGEQRRLPDADDLRRMCIITKSDLERIYGNIDRRERDKDVLRQELERKRELAAKSAQVTRHWPNTILGAREQKLEMKKRREEEDEKRRKAIDIEEEKLAAERRKEQIEKAKQLQYYETDRVRTFHSALLHSEVLKERDLQLDMKKRLAQMRQTDEEDDRQRYQEAENDFNRAEQEKREKKARERANLTEYHLAQMERRRAQQFDEKLKDHREGEEYRRLAEQHALEHMELEQYRRFTQKDTKAMYDNALREKQQVKQAEQMMDEAEDEELRIYAEAKKKIARLRREKEIQAHQEKQQARDHMIGYLGSLQKRAEADYDTQIFRAQAQREAKELREEQEKLDKRQKMQEEINKNREETRKRREVQREIEEREDAEMRQKKAETDQLYQMYQREKDKQRQREYHNLSEFYLKQAQERKDRERALKDAELEEVLLDKHMNDIDKKQFQDYAERVIAYMGENGRNTYPLKKVYAEEMKRFDQFDNNFKRNSSASSQNSRKSSGPPKRSLDDTKKHLGFQWELPKN